MTKPPASDLTAFLHAAEGSVVDVEAVRDFLALRLPRHMLPAAYRVVDALPLRPDGKVDRDLLAREVPIPTPAPPVYERAIDRQIARLVAEILSVEHVRLDVRLLDLGADSVSMIRIANRLEADLGLRPPLELLLDNPTVYQIGSLYAGSDGRA